MAFSSSFKCYLCGSQQKEWRGRLDTNGHWICNPCVTVHYQWRAEFACPRCGGDTNMSSNYHCVSDEVFEAYRMRILEGQ